MCECVDVWYAEAINQEKLLLPWDLKDLDLQNLLLYCFTAYLLLCVCVYSFVYACRERSGGGGGGRRCDKRTDTPRVFSSP